MTGARRSKRCRRCGICCVAFPGELLGGSEKAHRWLTKGQERGSDGGLACRFLRRDNWGRATCTIREDPARPSYCGTYPRPRNSARVEGCTLQP